MRIVQTVINYVNVNIAAMSNGNAEHNRKDVIVESFRVGQTATEIIQFFGCTRSTQYFIKMQESRKARRMFMYHARMSVEGSRRHKKDLRADFG